MVSRYYRNTGPTHHEYHYWQALADQGLNSPELASNQVSKNAVHTSKIGCDCLRMWYAIIQRKVWPSEYTHGLMGEEYSSCCLC